MDQKRCGDEEDLLHEDFLIQILVRLPIRSLLRFKSVCKSWLDLIESSFFIHLHTSATTSSSSSSKFGCFILHTRVFIYSHNRIVRESALHMLSSVSDESECVSRSSGSTTDQQPDYDDDDQEEEVFKVDSLGFPSCYKFCEFETKQIVGSCNGLVCLYDKDHKDVSLWNPATRQFRILPKSITIENEVCSPYHYQSVAFGFDVETKDYKVVLVKVVVVLMECLCRVQVYSLSTDSWRLLEQGISCLPGDDTYQYPDELLYLNGSCFFMPRSFDFPNRFIISFDLTKEIITRIQFPDHHQNQVLSLSYCHEKIALFTVCYEEIYEDYNIWVLNEHGSSSSSSSVNKESWTKLHSFRIEGKRPGEWNLPRGISNDGKFALLETSEPTELGMKMKLYNLVTKEVKRIFLSCTRVRSNAIAYRPSLVSIIGGNGATSAYRVIGGGTM